MVKSNISVDAFVTCATTKKPDNTLFPDVNSYNIGYEDMERYFDLILGIFKLRPEGPLEIMLDTYFPMFHRIVMPTSI